MNLVVLPTKTEDRRLSSDSARSWQQMLAGLPRFQVLAARLGDTEAQTAGVATTSLMWLWEYIEQAARRDMDSDEAWSGFNGGWWGGAVENPRSEPGELGKSLNARLGIVEPTGGTAPA